MNAAQIGEPGSGKTYNLRTLLPFIQNQGSKLAVIDVDSKFLDDPTFRDAARKGLIDVTTISQKQIEGSLTQFVRSMRQAPRQEPRGYYELTDAVDEIRVHSDKYFAVVLDTLTLAQEHLKKLLMNVGNKVHFEFTEWNLFLMNMENLFTMFYAIESPLKIVNMHQKYDKNDLTGEVKLLPLIDGQFKDKAGNYLSEFYHCRAKPQGNKPSLYVWHVTPDAKFMARSNVFAGSVDVPQDWQKVCEACI